MNKEINSNLMSDMLSPTNPSDMYNNIMNGNLDTENLLREHGFFAHAILNPEKSY